MIAPDPGDVQAFGLNGLHVPGTPDQGHFMAAFGQKPAEHASDGSSAHDQDLQGFSLSLIKNLKKEKFVFSFLQNRFHHGVFLI